MTTKILLILLAAACASSWGADTDARAARKAARKARLEAQAARRTAIAVKPDWKGWLAKNFPDASASWPEDCAGSFDAARGGAAWEFVGKGDIERDGVPTALMIRTKSAFDTHRPKRLIVEALRIARCAGGKWKDALSLEGAYDVSLSYDEPADPIAPGLAVSAALVDADGNVASEDEEFYFLPKLGRYGGQADREALEAGRMPVKARRRSDVP